MILKVTLIITPLKLNLTVDKVLLNFSVSKNAVSIGKKIVIDKIEFLLIENGKSN